MKILPIHKRYHKQQQFVCEFSLDVRLLRWEILWRNAPRIWRDFGSTLPFQTRLTQTKPVLPLSNEHGSQEKDQVRRQCCHNKHKKFPYRPTRDVSLLSGHVPYFHEVPIIFHKELLSGCRFSYWSNDCSCCILVKRCPVLAPSSRVAGQWPMPHDATFVASAKARWPNARNFMKTLVLYLEINLRRGDFSICVISVIGGGVDFISHDAVE